MKVFDMFTQSTGGDKASRLSIGRCVLYFSTWRTKRAVVADSMDRPLGF